jgi:hypothetical protein
MSHIGWLPEAPLKARLMDVNEYIEHLLLIHIHQKKKIALEKQKLQV